MGNKAVQEVYAAATFYDCDRAVVMTNATFTSGAVELAETLGVELMPGIDFAKKRFGVIGLVLLIAMVAMGGLLYIAIAKPELPEWLSFLQPERIADPRNIAFLSAGTVLSLLLLIMRCRRPRSYALRADTITAKQESGATAEGLADTEDGQLDEEDLTGDEDDPGDGEDDDLIDDADARLGEAGERLGNEDDLSGVPSVNGNAGGGEAAVAAGNHFSENELIVIRNLVEIVARELQETEDPAMASLSPVSATMFPALHSSTAILSAPTIR